MTGPDETLPPLRQDLRVLRAAPLPSGAASWVIFDPVRHRYFQVGRPMLEFLGLWGEGQVTALRRAVHRAFGREPVEGEVEALTRFLMAHELVEAKNGGTLARREAGRRHHWLHALIHNYLFFRIPLLRPQSFLVRTRWLADLVFSPIMFALATLSGLVGGLLVLRQWDSFVATGLDLLNLEGAAVFAVCLPIVKTLHEFGHAAMATRYGVRVPTMGIAFMVMAPFLYTDVSDAWRLASRRQRLAIDVAGLLVELMLAAFALLLWVFLPQGPLRSGVFVLATTSLAMGLLLNLNPFMRFDGYHILADAVGMPNLQTRAMVIGRWLLREVLFGLGAPCPEPLSRSAVMLIALYAYAIWIYRLILFLGIAVLVYHMAFKLLGIVLFLIEIVWFVALPIVNELARWWKGRAVVARHRRARVTFAVFGAAVLLVVTPLPTRVAIPVVAGARLDATLFAPMAARLVRVAVAEGEVVTPGQVLFELESPDLDMALRQEQIRLQLVELRLARAAGDPQDRNDGRVLEQQREASRRRLAGLDRQRQDLVLRAPHGGRIRDLDPVLAPGLWANQKLPLAHVVADGPPELRGFVAEDDLARIAAGAKGRFLPDDVLQNAVPARLDIVSETAVETLDIPLLASANEGPVLTVPEPSGKALRPLLAQYPVVLATEGPVVNQVVRGHAWIEGAPESLAARLLRRVLGVLIRESGA